jgi:phosphoenolpyruvate-protein kinase (PTS system EI component)
MRRDWYSLFMVVRGLVTVQGTQLHHVTQIARECGVPFINLPEERLENLPDGVFIEIDGQVGKLTILPLSDRNPLS